MESLELLGDVDLLLVFINSQNQMIQLLTIVILIHTKEAKKTGGITKPLYRVEERYTLLEECCMRVEKKCQKQNHERPSPARADVRSVG